MDHTHLPVSIQLRVRRPSVPQRLALAPPPRRYVQHALHLALLVVALTHTLVSVNTHLVVALTHTLVRVNTHLGSR
jgi:hypothetical protein